MARRTTVPIDGLIYCLDHGTVHEETTDPYDYGEADCRVSEHRRIQAVSRYGDLTQENW